MGWWSNLLASIGYIKFGADRHPASATLIASQTDMEQALKIADVNQMAGLVAGWKSPSPLDQIDAAVLARQILAWKMTDQELVRYVQHLQNRYSIAVGTATYSRYDKTVPAGLLDPAISGFRDRLIAELNTLSARLRLAYSISYIRDRHLARIGMMCFGVLLVCLAFAVTTAVTQFVTDTSVSWLNFIVIGVVGLAGAATSIARRANQLLTLGPLEEDPVAQASALEQSGNSLKVAALTGPIFALVLLLVFWCNAFKVTGLTPEFDVCKAGKTVDFQLLGYAECLKEPIDAAKLALWSFLAGFAEQIVPDVLNRFSKAADKSNSSAL